MTDGKTIDLQSNYKFNCNSDNNGTVIKNAFLKQNSQGYYLEILGRNGEAQKNLAINIILNHKLIKDDLHFTLKTNNKGIIFLGSLKNTSSLQTTSLDNHRYWYLDQESIIWPTALNVSLGEKVRLPFIRNQQAIAKQCSLFEIRRKQQHSDHTNKIQINERYLEISGLPEGNFQLHNKVTNGLVNILVTKGKKQGRFILGKFQTAVHRYQELPTFKAITHDDKQLKIQLENYSSKTRVDIIQSRFKFEESLQYNNAPYGNRYPPYFTHGFMPSFYLSGKNIGDEYRYILARRNSPVYPGNMLTRPGLLLNPWELKETQTKDQEAAGGDAFGGRSAKGRSRSVSRHGGVTLEERINPSYPSYNFLAPGKKVFSGLRPNDKGEIVLKQLGQGEMVHIFLFDENYRHYKKAFLTEQKNPYLDTRLSLILNPKKHFVESKKISILKKDEPFTVKSVSSAKVQTYDSLQKVYSLFKTLNPDKYLTEFSFILDWPQMEEFQKRELYSKYACHELNFFIYKKDPEFFNKVILPYYESKDPRPEDMALSAGPLKGGLKCKLIERF